MAHKRFWMPAGLYESLPLLYVTGSTVCLALGKALHLPVLVGLSIVVMVYALLILVARHRHRSGRSVLRPRDEDLCLPSLESRLRAEDAYASLRVQKRSRREAPATGPDFSDTWFVWEK